MYCLHIFYKTTQNTWDFSPTTTSYMDSNIHIGIQTKSKNSNVQVAYFRLKGPRCKTYWISQHSLHGEINSQENCLCFELKLFWKKMENRLENLFQDVSFSSHVLHMKHALNTRLNQLMLRMLKCITLYESPLYI